MQKIKISILNKNNEKLIGIKTLPKNKKKQYPTVILVHGFGVTKEEGGMFDNIAKNLSKEEILVFRFDFSGCGESDGDYSKTSLSKLKSELSEILNFVRLQPEVDSSKIGILAQSFGTSTTITLEPKVKSLILMGSIAHPKEIFIKIFREGYNPKGISTRIKSSGKITQIKPIFWKDLEKHNLLESIKKIHYPILFIHGEKDNLVPISEMETLFEVSNKPKEKIIIKNADHGLNPHRDKMYQIITSWFKKELK